MKKKLSVLLACVLTLAVLPGCSRNNNSNDFDVVVTDAPASENTPDLNGYTPQGEEKLHLTIESVLVSLSELEENDYQVTLTVSLDKNAGIVNSQWGLNLDHNCTFEASNRGMIVNTVHAINDETHFLWTAWAGQEASETGGLLELTVTIPENAAPGDIYYITYADTSATGASHQWKNLNVNYVEEDAFGWTNGTITVVA